jgi:hypothetical protein
MLEFFAQAIGVGAQIGDVFLKLRDTRAQVCVFAF